MCRPPVPYCTKPVHQNRIVRVTLYCSFKPISPAPSRLMNKIFVAVRMCTILSSNWNPMFPFYPLERGKTITRTSIPSITLDRRRDLSLLPPLKGEEIPSLH
ncbi:hypothetical protein V8G54_008676 [Vigna mungo]|uniref:Uncharacterized protein n=1 Tax=Vigna mungo TaxID=3915 RepID=A0AAQ3S6P7_VIGMU